MHKVTNGGMRNEAVELLLRSTMYCVRLSIGVMLLLTSNSAYGQSLVHVKLFAGAYNWSVTTNRGAQVEGSISLGKSYDEIPGIHHDTILFPASGIEGSFILDSNAISNLQIICWGTLPDSFSTQQPYCIIKFLSSIPFQRDSNNNIVATGRYPATGSAIITLWRDLGQHNYEYGSQNSSWNSDDSVAILIETSVKASVSALQSQTSFTSFEIWSSIGVLVSRWRRESEYESARRSLPPGCYFARLSGRDGASQVVKFVVAP